MQPCAAPVMRRIARDSSRGPLRCSMHDRQGCSAAVRWMAGAASAPSTASIKCSAHTCGPGHEPGAAATAMLRDRHWERSRQCPAGAADSSTREVCATTNCNLRSHGAGRGGETQKINYRYVVQGIDCVYSSGNSTSVHQGPVFNPNRACSRKPSHHTLLDTIGKQLTLASTPQHLSPAQTTCAHHCTTRAAPTEHANKRRIAEHAALGPRRDAHAGAMQAVLDQQLQPHRPLRSAWHRDSSSNGQHAYSS